MSEHWLSLSKLSLLTLVLAVVACAGCAAAHQPVAAVRAEANRLNERGIEAASRGDSAAAGSFAAAYRRYAAIEHYPGMVTTLLNTARLSMREGDGEQARQALARAEEMLAFVPNLAAEVAFEKAKLALRQGKLAEAATLAQTALAGSADNAKGRMTNLLAQVRVREGRPAEAKGLAERALGLARREDDRVEEANALRLLGELALAERAAQTASMLFAEALALDKGLAASARIAADLKGLAQAAEADGRLTDAAAFWQRAARVYEERNDAPAVAFCLERLAALYERLGDGGGAAAARERGGLLRSAK
jgi:tetratricopeptide (TPR) repeat protein